MFAMHTNILYGMEPQENEAKMPLKKDENISNQQHSSSELLKIVSSYSNRQKQHFPIELSKMISEYVPLDAINILSYLSVLDEEQVRRLSAMHYIYLGNKRSKSKKNIFPEQVALLDNSLLNEALEFKKNKLALKAQTSFTTERSDLLNLHDCMMNVSTWEWFNNANVFKDRTDVYVEKTKEHVNLFIEQKIEKKVIKRYLKLRANLLTSLFNKFYLHRVEKKDTASLIYFAGLWFSLMSTLWIIHSFTGERLFDIDRFMVGFLTIAISTPIVTYARKNSAPDLYTLIHRWLCRERTRSLIIADQSKIRNFSSLIP